jgi:hypothetical protein
MEIRKGPTLDELADLGKLPPIEWHINSLNQLVNSLQVLNAPDLVLAKVPIDALASSYSKFLNNYHREERIEHLITLRGLTDMLTYLVKEMSWVTYADLCIPNWAAQKAAAEAIGQQYLSLGEYIKQATSYWIAMHDFALGLAAVCRKTNPEPEKYLYNNLEKNA